MQIEECKCASDYPLILQWTSSANPFVCANCNLNIEIKKLTSELVEEIKIWKHLYEVSYLNWLNENDKINTLQNPKSELHQLGISLVEKIGKITPVFYWWHLNEDEKLEHCPNCSLELNAFLNNRLGESKVCHTCNIFLQV